MPHLPRKLIYSILGAVVGLYAVHMHASDTVTLTLVGLFLAAIGGHVATDLKHGGEPK